MKNAPMRFGGMSLRHNPAKLNISGKHHIRMYGSPCCKADSTSLGMELRRITGEGEMCGADCIEQYSALKGLQHNRIAAKLVLPHMQPLYAYLKELSLTAKPIDDVLSYRFEFIEAQSPRKDSAGVVCYMTESEGENLWDIAYAFSVPIEQLVALNPQIPHIGELKSGERVRVC